jgi:hypothetical protein
MYIRIQVRRFVALDLEAQLSGSGCNCGGSAGGEEEYVLAISEAHAQIYPAPPLQQKRRQASCRAKRNQYKIEIMTNAVYNAKRMTKSRAEGIPKAVYALAEEQEGEQQSEKSNHSSRTSELNLCTAEPI